MARGVKAVEPGVKQQQLDQILSAIESMFTWDPEAARSRADDFLVQALHLLASNTEHQGMVVRIVEAYNRIPK